jgi:probable phosphoglycerate mutase
MDIYFIRHGHPNYETDSLTELGNKQAKAVSNRLKNCNIERIYSSTMGRAIQTANYTANLLNLDVTLCDFMREVSWANVSSEPILLNAHPWNVAEHFVKQGLSLNTFNWQTVYPFNKSELPNSYNRVITGFDLWLEQLGYKRNGDYYRPLGKEKYKTVAMFSHAGATISALSHALNIPFIQLCDNFHIFFTSVTILRLEANENNIVSPKIILLNDTLHVDNLLTENVFN